MAQAMDFYLRCNSLKCRAQLKETAVVTTCSHIFCLHCASKLGLSHPTSGERQCPACQTVLLNPDDAASTILNPSEDYKTSVLSGLDPNTIMECAGRALVFWAYQTTQEIFYQEFLGKSLTEKYGALNTQMDKIIHNANSEISNLQTRMFGMQTSQEQLQKKNQELVELYREKCKKFTQITNLYNLLKSRAMRSQMQTAASDTVSQTLNSLGSSHNNNLNIPPPPTSASNHNRPIPSNPPQTLSSNPPQTPSTSRQYNVYPVDQDGVEQIHRYQRSGTGSSKGKKRTDITAMPPPPNRVIGHNSNNANNRNSNIPVLATPQHRTRLPPPSSRPPTGASLHPRNSAAYERFVNPTANSTYNHYPNDIPRNQGYHGEINHGRGRNDQQAGNGFFRPSGLGSSYFEHRDI